MTIESIVVSLFKMRERNVVLGILTLGLVARIVAAIVLPDQSSLLTDARSFRATAAEFVTLGRMSDPVEMPLYPLLIALFGHWQVAADIALSVLTIWLVYLLALEIFGNRLTAILAALATACYPPLIFFSVVGLSESLFITLLLSAFLFWYRGRFTLASLFAVLTILTRPIFDVAPLLLLYFAVIIHSLPPARALRHLAVYVVIYSALLTPWWLNNHAVYGHFVRLTAGFGAVLYAGNNPMNTTGGAIMGQDYSINQFVGIGNAYERDIAMRNAALNFIREHPWRFVKLAGFKFIRMWRLWPVNQGYSNWPTIMVSVLTFVPVLLLSALGLFFARAELRRLSPILLFGIGYTALNMVLAGTIRYRLPLEPFLLIFSGYAVNGLLSGFVFVQSDSGLMSKLE